SSACGRTGFVRGSVASISKPSGVGGNEETATRPPANTPAATSRTIVNKGGRGDRKRFNETSQRRNEQNRLVSGQSVGCAAGCGSRWGVFVSSSSTSGGWLASC